MLEHNNQSFNEKLMIFLGDDLFLRWRINPTRKLDEYWESFIQKNPELEKQFRQAILEFDEIRSRSLPLSEARLQVKEKIEQSYLSYKNKRRRIVHAISAAAAVGLLLIVSTLFFINRNNYQPDKILTLGNTVTDNEIQFFSGGEVLNLSNNSTLSLSGSGNSVIIQDSLSRKEVKLQEHTLNKLVIPYGKRSSLVLADGSKVWLNSGTEMEFPSTFRGSTREIRVSGEIYIEVAKTREPFIVHTLYSRVEVLGTSFNINAYEEESKESVVLVEGSVAVKSKISNTSLVLSPHQMAEISEGNIVGKTVNISEYISWKEGFMQFNKAPLDEILRKIGRYYNVEFNYPESIDLAGETCSGKLYLFEDITDILESFSDITLLNYEIQPDNIIYIKN